MKYQPNEIKVDLGSYRHYWRGVKKIGKTTMFRDILKEAYGDYKYGLVISPGNETGFKALAGIYAVNTPTWRSFKDTVTDLVDNKSDNEFKIIAIDTVDELVSIASDHVLDIHYQRKNERVDSLNAALGGYGAGQVMVGDLINDQIKRLESAGYGLVFIGHTKLKDIKEKNMEEAYQQLGGSLDPRFDKIFADKADVIAVFSIDKEVKEGHLVAAERFIYFRNDGFVDAGSRFREMPERVPMSAKAYLQAFEEGVKSSFESPVTDSQLAKMKAHEVKEREDEAKVFIEQEKTLGVDADVKLETVEDHRAYIRSLLDQLSRDLQKQKQAELKEKGIPTQYKAIEDIDILKQIIKVLLSR